MATTFHLSPSNDQVPGASRLAHLLGEMRREMNGAVVGSMRFYGDEYGLNYGVSLATIRAKAAMERGEDRAVDHKFARQLYKQEVRELRLAAFWFADPEIIDQNDEFDFWARGIINSEVAEEAAFALFGRCMGVEKWLDAEGELLHYAAVMSLAKRGDFFKLDSVLKHLEKEVNLLPKAVVVLLAAAIKNGVSNEDIEAFMERLPHESVAPKYIRDEIAWRLEFR